MHRLDLRQLRLVAAVARHASLTRAADELCISQPSASRQLTELEDSLGLLLFSRTPKAMIATAAGAELLEHGNALLAAADALEQRMQRRAREGGGQLRIAIDKVHCDDWIAEVVPTFRASHANVELTVQRVPDLLDALLKRDIDLAVIGEALPAPGIAYVELQRDEMLVIAPSAHPLADLPHVTPRDLRWTDLLYCFEFETSYLRRRYLEPQGIELNSFHCIDSIEAILRLVGAGEGLTVLPRRRVREALNSPQLVARRIGSEGMHFSWYAATAIDSPKAYLADFVELLGRQTSTERALDGGQSDRG